MRKGERGGEEEEYEKGGRGGEGEEYEEGGEGMRRRGV